MDCATLSVSSPLGGLTLLATDEGLCRVDFGDQKSLQTGMASGSCALPVSPSVSISERAEEILRQAERELAEYFTGGRREFSVLLHPSGTPFQQRV